MAARLIAILLLGPFALFLLLHGEIGIAVLLLIVLAAIILTRTKEKTCPRCAEKIKAAALVCRFCGYELPKSPDVIHL